MSSGSNDTTQELTLDAIGVSSPARKVTDGRRNASRSSRTHSSRAGHTAVAPSSHSSEPQPSQHSVLSLDDLSNEGKRDEEDGDGDVEDRPGSSTRRVEEKLQLNLRQQQEHYARQRQLFEDLRSDSATAKAALSPSIFSSSSHSSESDQHDATENNDSSNTRRAPKPSQQQQSKKRFQLEFESEPKLKRQAPSSLSSHTHDAQPRTSPMRHEKSALGCRNDKHALRELSRIKAKAISDYKHRMAESQQKQSRRLRPSVLLPKSTLDRHSPVSKEVVEELNQQEASNEALRKQLELLRRLQVENNRFRQDFRACREQNEALEDQDKTQKRELKHLRDDNRDLARKVEQDQQSLAVAAQTSRKFKSSQKQLSSAQQEIEKLQRVLHETLQLQEQTQAKTIGDLGEVTAESKRLKRSLKQLKQQEAKAADENELLRSTVEALENELNQLKDNFRSQKRENSELSSQLVAKASECNTIEASATACVQRMETGMGALQKAFDTEREKRKKLESQCSSLQTQLDNFEAEGQLKQQQTEKLEHHVTQLQGRLKDRKLMLQQHKQSSDEYVEELLERQTLDVKTIATLRSECEGVEQQLEMERIAALDARQRVADETRKVRKDVEGLRNYIERSLQANSGVLSASIATANADQDGDTEAEPPRPCASKPHHDGSVPPELQFLQGATSALRTETMNFVHEFQRTKHATRTLTKKLKAATERVTELEHQHNEDALKAQELKEQRVLSDQAREIVVNEKLELLKWSQQTCEKNEALENELNKCDRFAQTLLLKLRNRRESQLDGHHDLDDGGSHDQRQAGRRRRADSATQPSLPQHLKTLDAELDLVFSSQQELRQELTRVSRLTNEQESEIQALRHELEAKTQESELTMAELENLHVENAREQKAHFDAIAGELEREKCEFSDNLHSATAQLELLMIEKEHLQTQIDSFEQDLPVLATVLHLFVLVVPPLVLQVSELLSQKRFLVRENAEYAQSHEQIECIGQVLKELVPLNSLHQLVATDRQRHRRFRRVVIAVFALNRFQKCGVLHSTKAEAANGDLGINTSGSFGTCTSLKAPKKRRSSGSSSSLHRKPPPTAIKVLASRQTLASPDLRELLERLKLMGIVEKVTDTMDMGADTVPYFGSLLVQVLATIDPSAKETLVENTSGAFHCHALLERSRRGARRYHHADTVERDDFEQQNSNSESDLSTVDLIRKRILTLGKRVEDLHFQRNSLQKDNYDFQFQLEQQATRLKQMDVLIQKTSEQQDEMEQMRLQSHQLELQAQQRLDAKSQELTTTEREIQAKDDDLTCAKAQLQALGDEISDFQTQIQQLDTEKQELHDEVTKLKLLSIENEEKAETAKAGAKKQDEEVRNLKQAARKAHELYQKMNWQLEQEIAERASLQASVDLIKRQKEVLEKELHETKLRDLEKSFESERPERPTDSQAELKTKKVPKHQRVRFASSQHEHESDSEVSESEDHHESSRKKTSGFGQMLEDTCLYHKYEKPSGSAVRDYDSSANRESDDDLQSSHQSPHTTDANSKFLDEWRRLQISSAFDDSGKSRSHHQPKPSSSKASTMITPLSSGAVSASKQVAREVEIQTNRRRIEIDKVNSAVHDYMDRIDEKLQQMYGIPPSTASRVRESEEQDDFSSASEDEGAVRGEARAAAAAYEMKRIIKADETRPVHWYG